MNKDVLIQVLSELAGPIGPFLEMDTIEDFNKIREEKYAGMGDDTLDVLLDIIENPPKISKISDEDLEYEVVQAVAAIGKRNVQTCLQKIKPLLYTKARPAVIDIVGELQNESGIILLEELLNKEQLTDDEMIRLVDSLYDIKGERAIEILKIMKTKDISSEVLEEIDSCLNILGL